MVETPLGAAGAAVTAAGALADSIDPHELVAVRSSVQLSSQDWALQWLESSLQQPRHASQKRCTIVERTETIGLRMDDNVFPTAQKVTAVGHVRRGFDGQPLSDSRTSYECPGRSTMYGCMIWKLTHKWRFQRGWCVVLFAAALGIVGLAVWGAYRQHRAWRQWQQQLQAELESMRRLIEGVLQLRLQKKLMSTMMDALNQAADQALVVGQAAITEREPSGVSSSTVPKDLDSLMQCGEVDEMVVVEGEGAKCEGEICVVCLHRRRKAVFVPCGHRVCCVSCSRVVRTRNSACPVCRARVEAAYRVFDA